MWFGQKGWMSSWWCHHIRTADPGAAVVVVLLLLLEEEELELVLQAPAGKRGPFLSHTS